VFVVGPKKFFSKVGGGGGGKAHCSTSSLIFRQFLLLYHCPTFPVDLISLLFANQASVTSEKMPPFCAFSLDRILLDGIILRAPAGMRSILEEG